ncbi:MAG: hypothetical protein D3904_01640 [Candidatus Electrothrix sp. EH2]|nr:hypothetical protein [Candidatus Electrothrix sp. EH2]
MKKSVRSSTVIILFFLVTLPSCTYYAALEREAKREVRTKKELVTAQNVRNELLSAWANMSEQKRMYAEATGLGAGIGAVACKDNRAACAVGGVVMGAGLGYIVGDRQANHIIRTYSSPAHNIPQFPWPPPHPSAYSLIPSKLLPSLANKNYLKDVAKKLEAAFDQAGYSQKKYYQVPDGFALVSQLEQFNPDGTSKTPPDRWVTDYLPPEIFSLTSYIKALFTAKPGRYRIIAFIVTSQPFKESKKIVTRDEAMAWLDNGMFILPESIGKQPYTDKHYCTALIYEFEQPGKEKKPSFKPLSNLTGKDHLQKSKLWAALKK